MESWLCRELSEDEVGSWVREDISSFRGDWGRHREARISLSPTPSLAFQHPPCLLISLGVPGWHSEISSATLRAGGMCLGVTSYRTCEHVGACMNVWGPREPP